MQHSARRIIRVLLGILAGLGCLVPASGARIRHHRQRQAQPNTGLLLTGGRIRHHRQRQAQPNTGLLLTGGRTPASVGEGIHDIEKALQAVLSRARSARRDDDDAIMDNVEVLLDITQDMLGKVEDFHGQQQDLLDSECKLLSACASTMRDNLRVAALSEQVLTTKTTEHGSCRKDEAALAGRQEQCRMLQSAMQKLKKAACSALADYEAEVGEEARHQAAMDKLPGEDTETYLDRLGRRYCDEGGLLYEFNQKEEACAEATNSVDDTAMGCTATGTAYGTKKATCDSLQSEMAEAACDHVSMETEACRTYGTCRVQTLEAYKLTVASADSDTSDRQTEWKVLSRIECMLEVIAEDPGDVDEEALKDCTDLKQYKTENLKMNYTCDMQEVACRVTETYPGTSHYNELLTGLTPTAPAMPVQRCSGMMYDLRQPPGDGVQPALYKFYRLNVPKHSGSRKFLCIAEWAMYRDNEKITTPANDCGVGPCSRMSSSMGGIWATKYAFDTDLSQDHAWCSNFTYGWISYEFALPMPVDRMQVVFWKPTYAANGTWTIDASNDGRNWATLKSLVLSNGKDNRRQGTYDYNIQGLRPSEIPPGKKANFTLEVWTSVKLGAATATGAEYQMMVGGEWTKKEILCYMAQRGQPCRKQMELQGWPSEVRLIARQGGKWGLAKAFLAKQGGQARVLLDSPEGQSYSVGNRFWLDATVKSMAVMSLVVPEAGGQSVSPMGQHIAMGVCTCDMSINSDIDNVYVDGVDVTSKVKGDLGNWGVRHRVNFECGRSTVLAVSGSGAGCNGGGFALKCSSTDKASPWHELIADRTWKVFGGQCVNPPCLYGHSHKNTVKGSPAGWYLPSFDDSGWKNAAKGKTNYVQATIGTPFDICSPDGPGWLFRSSVHKSHF